MAVITNLTLCPLQNWPRSALPGEVPTELAPAKPPGISVRVPFNCRDLGISQNVAFAEALVKDPMSPQMKQHPSAIFIVG